MDKVAEKILLSRTVVDAAGNCHPLHSETVQEQCEILQEAVRAVRPRISVEIGLAFGVSTLFICEALKEGGAEKHIVMDPFQQRDWSNIGLKNISDAGYADLVEFHPHFSHQVLPELLKRDLRIDFAYVDTTKLFDIVLVDAYFLTLLMRPGGLMFIDDCTGPGIRKVCRFLARHPSWEVYKTIGTTKRNFKEILLQRVARFVPKARRIFRSDVLLSDAELGVNGQCVGFRKISDDQRHWSWFEDF
jgi:predicted O-methyltransferase YrrM